MSIETKNRRFKRIALATVAAIGLVAIAVPLTPAKAQVYFGFGPGGIGFNITPPVPYYYQPYPYYYYNHRYYPHHYRGW